MRHTINLSAPQYNHGDSVTFIGIAEKVTMSISGFVETVRLANLHEKKIEMIKMLRCLVMVNQNQYGDTIPDETMSLKFAKDIVEWFMNQGLLTRY